MKSDRGRRFQEMLDKAAAAKSRHDAMAAIVHYLNALRLLTPNDEQIELSMAMRGRGATPVSEQPSVDLADSSIRSDLVAAYRSVGQLTEALHHARIAVFLDRLLHGDRSNNTSASLLDLGLVQLETGHTDQGLAALLESEEIDTGLIEGNAVTPELAWRVVRRGEALSNFGFVESAARFAKFTLRRFVDLFTDIDQRLVAVNHGCQCLQNVGEHALALPYLEDAARVGDTSATPTRLMDLLYANLATLLEEMTNFDAADIWWRKVSAASQFFGGTSAAERALITSWSERQATLQRTRRCAAHDVFLSYNGADSDLAQELVAALGRYGVHVWTYQHMENWAEQRSNQSIIDDMESHIADSAMVVSIGSGSSLSSEFVIHELDYAVTQRVPVLVWYPGGVRLRPDPSSTWSTMNTETLRMITFRLTHSLSYFGYGLRERTPRVIADAVVKRFTKLYPAHVAARWSETSMIRGALDGTRLWPVLVDEDGTMVASELLPPGDRWLIE